MAAHADTWETVVRKAAHRDDAAGGHAATGRGDARQRSCRMTRRRARSCAATPNPGRPLLRRLNRAEYGNVIRDLLAIEVDVRVAAARQTTRRSASTTTPICWPCRRRCSSAISSPPIASARWPSAIRRRRPAADTFYTRGDQSQSQHQRRAAARHRRRHRRPPLRFRSTASTSSASALFRTNTEAIRGLEHPHQLEIAVDGERVFLAHRRRRRRSGADGHHHRASRTPPTRGCACACRSRPGRALVTATFIRKIAESTNRLRPFLRSNAGTYDSTGRPHIETLTITGPFKPTGPGDTPSRRRVFICRPPRRAGSRRRSESRARGGSSSHAGAPRVSASGRRRATWRRCWRSIATAARRAASTPASSSRCGVCWRARRSSSASRTIRRRVAAGHGVPRERHRAGVAAVVLPLEQHARRRRCSTLAAAGRLRQPAVLEAQVRRMLADPKADALVENFAGQWLHIRNLQNIAPNTDEFPDFDNDLRDAFRRETELFFGSIMREDRNVLDLMTRRLHVRQRAAGEALRPAGRLRQPVPPRHADRRCAARAAGQGQHPAGHLARRSHGADAARQVDSREPARHAAAAAAARRAAVRADGRAQAANHARAAGERIAPTRPAPAVTASMDRSGLRWRTSTPSARWRDARGRAAVDAEGALPDGTPAVGVVGAAGGAARSTPTSSCRR